ncbi:MAG: hypothetical protein H7836_15495 [Magnetococcus sp. YQC-3]
MGYTTNYQLKKQAIPYPKTKQILLSVKDKRTQALMVYQYVFAARVGELARVYVHRYRVKGVWVSQGVLVGDLSIRNEGREIVLTKPNFKQAKIVNTADGSVVDISKFSVPFMVNMEPEFAGIILGWVKGRNPIEPLFDIQEAMMRKLIRREFRLQGFDRYSSHWLRQWRAWHIGELTGDPYAVQAILGHSDLNTSLAYVSGLSKALRDLDRDNKTFDSLLGKSGGD